MTAGRLPGAPQGKLPGQLSELEAAFPTQTHEGAEWNRLRCHFCQPVVTDGDGSTFTRQLGAESPRDSPLRVPTLYQTRLTVPPGNRPHCHTGIQCAQRDTSLLCGLRRSSRNVSSCFIDTGSDPSDSSLVLRTSRESAESDPELQNH